MKFGTDVKNKLNWEKKENYIEIQKKEIRLQEENPISNSNKMIVQMSCRIHRYYDCHDRLYLTDYNLVYRPLHL